MISYRVCVLNYCCLVKVIIYRRLINLYSTASSHSYSKLHFVRSEDKEIQECIDLLEYFLYAIKASLIIILYYIDPDRVFD